MFFILKTSQELQMLSSVTKIVINSQLSELWSVSQMPQVSRVFFAIVEMINKNLNFKNVNSFQK